jgi:limonene-1,2-epoxide hydrolase
VTPEPVDERYVTTVIRAVAGDDWAVLRRVLHPYLRFTDENGRTTRGRTKVIALLRMTERLETPTEIVLRDGQIYFWCCPAS